MMVEAQTDNHKHMLPSDDDLMLRYREGDDKAFKIIYQRYEKPVFSFINRIVMSAADAEDLCQETFYRLAKGKEKYKSQGNFKTWLLRIALNLSRDRLRRKKIRALVSLDGYRYPKNNEKIEFQNSISNPDPNPAENIDKNEIRIVVQKAFAQLPHRQRTVISLKEYQKMKFCEIAEIMKCPVGTVKSLNHRGHERLKKILSKYMD
jgi:RNA polymerase sigma-70 factor (ECF subfamily)